ncbi:hypothetical protein ACFYOC_25525 [Nocardiopsis alba]|uniref:hypothetical protein n=1 Tax=Nocardiopsis alba TaxID=53437 RepID=UPI0036782442
MGDVPIDPIAAAQRLDHILGRAPHEDLVTGVRPCLEFLTVVGIDLYCEHSHGAGHEGRHCVHVAGHLTTWSSTSA